MLEIGQDPGIAELLRKAMNDRMMIHSGRRRTESGLVVVRFGGGPTSAAACLLSGRPLRRRQFTPYFEYFLNIVPARGGRGDGKQVAGLGDKYSLYSRGIH